MWLKIIFITLLYMTFSNIIKNNNLFYKLYKNKKYKNSLNQIILYLAKTMDTSYDTIINIVTKNSLHHMIGSGNVQIISISIIYLVSVKI